MRPPLRRTLRLLGRGLSDVFYPPLCVACRELVEGSDYRHLCVTCARRLEFIRPPCCETCGHPLFLDAEGERTCPHCPGLGGFFDRGRAAVRFRGPARALILELKYRQGRHVLDDLEQVWRLSPLVLALARGAVLVPVPLHPRKQRERGYNQSHLLARALARAAGATCAPLLRRIADTPSQTGFDRRARQANLKNAFALARGAALNPRVRYLLVDDVFTTGSTLNGCARALRAAGCLSLDAAVFAHG